MQHYEAVEALHDILPLIKSEGSAEKALLKYANEHRLASTQLVKLAHVFNTARTHSYLDRNPENRGGAFPLVDTENLVSDYEKMPESDGSGEVSFKIASRKTTPNFFKLASTEPAVKSAEEKKESEPQDPAYVECDAREKARIAKAKKEEAVIESDAAFQIVSDEKHEAKKAFDTLVDGLKSADFKAFEEDVMMHGYVSEGHRAVLNQLADHCNGFFGCEKIARCVAVNPTRKLAYDRTGLIPTFQQICEHLQNAEDADKYAQAVKRAAKCDIDELDQEEEARRDDVLIKHLKGDDAAPTEDERIPIGSLPDTGGRGFSERRPDERRGHDTPTSSAAKLDFSSMLKPSLTYDYGKGMDNKGKNDGKAGDSIDNAAKQISEILKSIPSGGDLRAQMFGKPDETQGALSGIFSDEAPGKRQRHVDNKVMDTRASANLQRLIMTDPILREADPDHIVDIYNDLRNAKPDLAHSPQQMAFALREALQYGGVPASTAKTLVDIDKAHQQAEESRRKNTDFLYNS